MWGGAEISWGPRRSYGGSLLTGCGRSLHALALGGGAALTVREARTSNTPLHLAASDCGLPLFLLRPAQTLEASAAATRWRVGTAMAARDTARNTIASTKLGIWLKTTYAPP